MPIRISNYMKFFVAAFLLVSCCLVEADAQTRRKRTRRTPRPAAPKPVITNPPIAPPTETATAGDVKIISTADAPGAEPAKSPEPEAAPSPAKNAEGGSDAEIQKTINALSSQ